MMVNLEEADWSGIYMLPVWSCVSIVLFPFPAEPTTESMWPLSISSNQKHLDSSKRKIPYLQWMIGELFQFFFIFSHLKHNYSQLEGEGSHLSVRLIRFN